MNGRIFVAEEYGDDLAAAPVGAYFVEVHAGGEKIGESECVDHAEMVVDAGSAEADGDYRPSAIVGSFDRGVASAPA